MGDFETFQRLRKLHHLTHEATANLLHVSRGLINQWVCEKKLPKWPVLLLKRKLSINFELPEIKSPEQYLKAFYEVQQLTHEQVAEIIGIKAPRFRQWLYQVSPCPVWAVESLILGMLFDKEIVGNLAQIRFQQVRRELLR